MRRPAALVFALSSLACHADAQTRAPDPVPNPAAALDSLIEQIAVLPDQPRPGVCERIDAELAALHETAVGQKADYARAEAALRCGRPDRWEALHEQLARTDYMPSLVRLGNDAVALEDWDRAIAIVRRIAERSDEPGERERMQALELRLIHARWVERGAPEDFARLEREAKVAIVRDPKQLDARAALIRLYAEQAAITGDEAPLILAQVSEREARKVAAALGSESPTLELVSGFVRELEGDRPAAVAAWTRALELNAALVEPRLWLGLAAIDRREYALAQAQLEAFLEVYPDHVDALLAYGAAARGNGELGAAKIAYARALKLSPDDPRTLWNLALANDPWDDSNRYWTSELYSVQENLLRSFIRAHDRLGPPSCPPRGDAPPDQACVREAAALDLRHERALDMLTYLDHALIGCRIHSIAADDRALEADRREQLLELERKALEAGTLVPVPEAEPE